MKPINRLKDVMRIPESGRIIGDGFRSLCDTRSVGLKEEVLELSHVAVGPDVLATVPERDRGPCSMLLCRWLGEELNPFLLEPHDRVVSDAVVYDLEEPDVLTGVHNDL